PSVHHKDVVAKSLVSKYPVLKSESADVPQAVWFYPNGRGYGKHGGKLHYHIEYMVKKDKKQVRHSKAVADAAQELSSSSDPTTSSGESDSTDLADTINKLKFVVPSKESYKIIRNDWIKTMTMRNVIRQKNPGSYDELIEMFPLSTSFDGLLIDLDFVEMFPSATNGIEDWNALQDKIVQKFNHLQTTVCDHFIRSLLIIREKNPSRGVKRVNKGSQKIVNLLERVLEWINPEDDIDQFAAGYRATDSPVLIIKGPMYSAGETYIRIGKRVFTSGSEIQNGFFTMIKAHYFFNLKFEPSLSNFYSFFLSEVFHVAKPSTTVNGFMLQLK
ncbi:hypothetical protein RP20_CCG006869, partial [Aedes albopictus]